MEEMCCAVSRLLCGDGVNGYKIYYEEDLFEVLPEDTRNRETLEAVLKNLRNGGYIEVKYARGNAFCIKSVREFVPAPKQDEPENTVKESNCPPTMAQLPKNFYLSVCLLSFLGSLVAGCIFAIIYAIFGAVK